MERGVGTARRLRGVGRVPVLGYAAEDLAAGVSHDGPRAFSQAHFTHTRAREDVAAILLDGSASEASLLALGLRRSPYLGLGGPVTLHTENLQAAEAACDTYSDLAVTWTAGQPADSPLRLITHLADQVEHVLIITDADLGGVRIAQRVLAALNHPEAPQAWASASHRPTTDHEAGVNGAR